MARVDIIAPTGPERCQKLKPPSRVPSLASLLRTTHSHTFPRCKIWSACPYDFLSSPRLPVPFQLPASSFLLLVSRSALRLSRAPDPTKALHLQSLTAPPSSRASRARERHGTPASHHVVLGRTPDQIGYDASIVRRPSSNPFSMSLLTSHDRPVRGSAATLLSSSRSSDTAFPTLRSTITPNGPRLPTVWPSSLLWPPTESLSSRLIGLV